jgi:hypothetical protein
VVMASVGSLAAGAVAKEESPQANTIRIEIGDGTVQGVQRSAGMGLWVRR